MLLKQFIKEDQKEIEKMKRRRKEEEELTG
jgi:hypothetical protein